MGLFNRKSCVLLVETIKDTQSVEYFISAFPLCSSTDYLIIAGPLAFNSLRKSNLFSSLLRARSHVDLLRLSICTKEAMLSRFVFDILLALIPLLSILNVNLSYIDAIWRKYISVIGYSHRHFSYRLACDLLIPWRKVSKNLHSLINMYFSIPANCGASLYLIPHAPIYDNFCFDLGAFHAHSSVVPLLPHRYSYSDLTLPDSALCIPPSPESLHRNLGLNNAPVQTRENGLTFLYLAQKISRYHVTSQKPYTFQELDLTKEYIRSFFEVAAKMSIKARLILRIPLQMCHGSISREDFEEFPELTLSNDRLLFDDIYASDFCISEFTSAVKYAALLRPTVLIKTPKFFHKTSGDRLLKDQYNALGCIQSECISPSAISSLLGLNI